MLFLKPFQKITGTCLLVVTGIGMNTSCVKEEKPNFLWLIAEDLSPDLACYGIQGVQTPNLDKLASEGILYTNAYSSAPVSSPTRSAMMTGMYQTSIDAHNHRSHQEEAFYLPDSIPVITQYFKNAGYFTSNARGLNYDKAGKTDWNFTPREKAFDGTDWQDRKEGQPFFSQINFHEVHRMGGKRAEELTVSPDSLVIPPYYPDHEITRKDWAMYLSSLEVLDRKIGKVMKRLKESGELENTIIFFFGDHGRNQVRGKQWLYEGGIKIPLIVRYPKKFNAGQKSDRFVSSIDFAPSCMDLAGIQIPDHLEGQVFLGENATERECIFAARDRCDETVDRIRSVRKGSFKYIRNFYPERPYTQYNHYKETYYPVLKLLHKMHKTGELDSIQELFMADTRPVHELYHLENDPWEIHNLAKLPEYQDKLQEMQLILDQWIQETGDMGRFEEKLH